MTGSATSVVVATHERSSSLLRTLHQLSLLPETPQVIVVDNGSADGTASLVRERYPAVNLITLRRNAGAAARTLGASAALTPYVAFCDDDGWWAPGSLAGAARILDRRQDAAVLNARILVDAEERIDPACVSMAASGLHCDGGGEISIHGFMAGASVVRRAAFLAAGGYHERFHIGAEEALVAVDLLAAGWRLLYCPDLVFHHHPHRAGRNPQERRRLVLRNRLWTAWLRLSLRGAWRSTRRLAALARHDPAARSALLDATRGLSWIARERRPVERALEHVVERLVS